MLEEELITKLRSQDQGALAELIRQYGDYVLQVIWHQLPSSYERSYTSDIANRCYFQIWSKISTFDETRGNFKTWLGAIVKHQAIDYQRGLNATFKQMDIADMVIPTAPPDEPLELGQLLNVLSEKEREIFQLYFEKDLTPEEISQRLRMRRGAVYKHLSRARHKLQQEAVKNDFGN
ncbi:RNA polymerase sigma factor [Lapidilactobacillus wuchangensis]|uniref:RNA polymerase sigma factor n=1 Tax=Lapidilactobacillus wuchangensis TaxID=2486001 RepID=UPI000F7AAAC2|nr:sigma-70 family RNA polymerase sigma factor [Lapidilactobacillus wuchangensis]